MKSTTEAAPVRVGMISPCGGGNLGDAAIIEALMESIQARVPEVNFFGVTQRPEDTQRRHRIPAYPIAAPRYRLPARVQGTGRKAGIAKYAEVLARGCARVGALMHKVASEFRHIVASYRVLSGADMFVVAGGGALDDYWGGAWSHPYDLLKWACLSRLSGTPFVVLSVGYGTRPTRLSTILLRLVMRLAVFSSFRDRRTIELVRERLGLKQSRFAPDLAFAASAHETRPVQAHTELVVGVSPIAFADPRSWPVQDAGFYRRYLDELAGFVDYLRTRGHRIVFFCSDTMDARTLRDLHAICGLHRETEESDVDRPEPYYKDVHDLELQLAACDVVVASRLHGVILAHRMGKPALAVSYDWKVAVHMEEVGQSAHVLDIRTVGTASLVEKFERLVESRAESQQKLDQVSADYRQANQLQFDEVVNRFLRSESFAPARPAAGSQRRQDKQPQALDANQ